ncbi:uncharacterized protein A4U43_C05F30750 [Asparagus officinalis]|uniref:Uncharacterized protein n=1 Tax=Asparagus officinalis TaxID=4686 RepID=A0A5P1EVP1_ASPOF|nr:uncharacterized protein A4U43_C05F30750 [Asparagus officinalis]
MAEAAEEGVGEVGGEAAEEAVNDAEERRGTDKDQLGLEEGGGGGGGDGGAQRKRARELEGRPRKRPLSMPPVGRRRERRRRGGDGELMAFNWVLRMAVWWPAGDAKRASVRWEGRRRKRSFDDAEEKGGTHTDRGIFFVSGSG